MHMASHEHRLITYSFAHGQPAFYKCKQTNAGCSGYWFSINTRAVLKRQFF